MCHRHRGRLGFKRGPRLELNRRGLTLHPRRGPEVRAHVDGLEAQDRRVWLVGDSSMHQLSSAFLCLFHKRHQRSYRPTLRTARLSARKGGDLGSWLKKNGDKLLRDGDVLVLNAGVEYNALNLYQRDLKAAFRILKNISDFKPGLKLVWKDAVAQHFA